MMKKDRERQKYIYQTLKPVQNLLDRYATAVPAVSELEEEDISWINEQIRRTWENLKKTDIKGFSGLRKVRNEISHQQNDFSEQELEKLWERVFPKLQDIKQQLEQELQNDKKNKKKRRFRKFGPVSCGSETERTQLLDAIEDACDAEQPDKIEFPENRFSQRVKQILDETLGINENQKYITDHQGLSKNIQEDVLDWVKQVDDRLSSNTPFQREALFIESLEEEAFAAGTSTLSGIREKYENVSDGIINFGFYQTELDKIETKKPELQKRKKKALFQHLKEAMTESLIDRKNTWQLALIDELLKRFKEELLQKLENFKKLESYLSVFFDNTGLLWDMSKGMFKNSGFDILQTYADLLEEDSSLSEMAALLGKHSSEQKKYEKELRAKTVIKTDFHVKPAIKGQITGLKTSSDISSILPSELALLKNPATKKLFELKFAQHQLLSFRYQNNTAEQKSNIKMEEVRKEKKENCGPVIICVDTSGSMNGTPENIAKTITFALAKITAEEKRSCFLISFSTSIETLDLSTFASDRENPLSKLVQFLRMSFNGGTDALPALNYALDLLQKKDYKNADVLMISDFVMNNLDTAIINKIETEKTKKTDFYRLLIGSNANKQTISVFNHNWNYDITDSNAGRHLVEQLAIVSGIKNQDYSV